MTNERDDEILGRALARAIETQPVRDTPYEASRLAARSEQRGGFPFWQLAGAAAVLALAVAFGSWFTRPTEPGPVATSPTPTPMPTATVVASASASPTPVPREQTVFIAPDGLPPQVRTAKGGDPSAPVEERIKMRVEALNRAVSGLGGTTLDADPKQFFVRSVKVQGDTATIDYASRFPPFGSAQDAALARQIVYTATEEATIMRVLVTANGKPMETGHLVWDRALTRDDVDGYGAEVEDRIDDAGGGDVPTDQLRLARTFSVDAVAPGLARFVIQFERTAGALPQAFLPRFDAVLYGPSATDQSGLPGKASLWVTVAGTDPKLGLETVDRSPLRSINTISNGAATTYQLKIDAAYPWRVFTLTNPTRLVVDIGGGTESVSDRIAVYAPRPMAMIDARTSRTVNVSGAARTFEANVVWRVRDASRRVVANGFTTATLGSSIVWGTFETQITLPPGVSGFVTIEVFEGSPKDGSDQGLVAVPVEVR